MEQQVRCDTAADCGASPTSFAQAWCWHRLPHLSDAQGGRCGRHHCVNMEVHVRCNPVDEPEERVEIDKDGNIVPAKAHAMVTLAAKAKDVLDFISHMVEQEKQDIAKGYHRKWPGHWGEPGRCPTCGAEGPDAKRKAQAEEIMRDDGAEMTGLKVRSIIRDAIESCVYPPHGMTPSILKLSELAAARIMTLKSGE